MKTLNEFWNWIFSESHTFISELTLPAIIIFVFGVLKIGYKKLQEISDSKSLFPYYDVDILKKAEKDYIRTKCQNVDPSDEINLKSSYAFSAKEDLLNFFFKKVFKAKDVKNQFYLILADSGMGKTTFILNLFSRYNSILKFIFRKYRLKLIPLGIDEESLIESISKIEKKEKTILLLDGFDESPNVVNDDIKNKFDNLINLVQNFRIVIITCRTHYFSSQNEEPYELKIKKFNTNGNGYHSIKKMYISPFDDNDIKKYINKKFHFFQYKKRKKAFNIIDKTDDLLARPMLLSYIEDFVSSKEKFFETKTDVYEVLILAWIERESLKYPEEKRYTFTMNLAFFSYELVRYIYINYDRNGLLIPFDEVIEISKEFNIDLSKIEMKSRSLLNRNSNGFYKFSHKSIFEFLLAYVAYFTRGVVIIDYKKSESYKKIQNIDVEFNLHPFDQALLFFEEMVLDGKMEFKLPAITEKYDGTNLTLVREIIREKNKLNNTHILDGKSIEWLTETKYRIK